MFKKLFGSKQKPPASASQSQSQGEQTDTQADLQIGFIILGDKKWPNPTAVINSAQTMGFHFTHEPGDNPDGPQSYIVSDDEYMILALIDVPHPDVADMPRGPLSPDDYDELIAGPAHLIVTIKAAAGKTVDDYDIIGSALIAAVAGNCNALGVSKVPSVLFHRPDLFIDVAKEGLAEQTLPFLTAVDITVAPEDGNRMSFLSHNMPRYGQEDFYVTCHQEDSGAFDFILNMISFHLSDRSYRIPTGDTVGGDKDQRILVQRVASPTGQGPDVIKLDL